MLKRIRELASDSVIYGLASVLSQLVSLVLVPFYTRALRPEDYGALAMLAILSQLFGPIASLGLQSSVFRKFHDEKSPDARARLLGTALLSVAATSAVLAVIGCAARRPLAELVVGDAATAPLVVLVMLAAFLANVSSIPMVTLRAERRARVAATLQVAELLVSVSLGILLVLGLRWGVAGVMWADLAAKALTCGLQMALTWRRFRFRLDRSLLPGMLRYGAPMVPHRLQAMALVLYGQYAVRQELGLAELGLYGIAARFAKPVMLAMSSIQTAWVPTKFEIHAEDRDPGRSFASLTTYYVAFMGCLWMATVMMGPPLMRLLMPPSYHGATALLPVLALVPLAQGLYFMGLTGLELGRTTGRLPVITLVGLAVVLLTATPSIRAFGPAGAAWSQSLSWAVMAAVGYPLARGVFPVSHDWRSLLAMWGGGFVLYVLAAARLTGETLSELPARAAVVAIWIAFVVAVLASSSREGPRVRRSLSRITGLGRHGEAAPPVP